jgi:hypothetical protein
VSYSHAGGHAWADATAPNGFVRGDAVSSPHEYFQSSGDTSVAWDTRGNAYLSCQEFKRGNGVSPDADQSSGFYVYCSTGFGGASFNFTGRPVAEHNDTAGAGNFLLDNRSRLPFVYSHGLEVVDGDAGPVIMWGHSLTVSRSMALWRSSWVGRL